MITYFNDWHLQMLTYLPGSQLGLGLDLVTTSSAELLMIDTC